VYWDTQLGKTELKNTMPSKSHTKFGPKNTKLPPAGSFGVSYVLLTNFEILSQSISHIQISQYTGVLEYLTTQIWYQKYFFPLRNMDPLEIHFPTAKASSFAENKKRQAMHHAAVKGEGFFCLFVFTTFFDKRSAM
jgi:hypothetical protein